MSPQRKQRQYAGFGTAQQSNERYRYLLSQGTTGLSVAFDLPTQMGMDSDDPRCLGEVGKAFVVVLPGADLAEQSVIDHTREHLANFKIPRSVEFIDALPRNPGGKVVKPLLRQRSERA